MTLTRNAAFADGPAAARRGGAWRIAAILLSIVLALFGIVLFGGGLWLIWLGGSWYYGLAGAGLLATAYLVLQQRMAALKLYLVVWVLTLIWAFWEVGFNFWAQIPRLVAPTVVLVLLLAILPALRPRRT
ncbi:glucose dehydrogenase [Neorhizobium sp. JUb45]|uniref:glucose dehydrogenase n=1 Tax=unclassified Neorhizobium TaxID=2629175 RepID=UPI0010511105|nr:glucose dehydrogenase [Neorhizobium sp. JUb45]TCR02580.1 hypothetical protein EDF70_1034 [Neorhizobium sp. JUb45]